MTGTQMMVVLIVAIVMFASIVKSKHAYSHGGPHRLRRRGHAVEHDGGEAENARLQAEVTELKKRLAVLERITVEKENSLERQIEDLRDR